MHGNWKEKDGGNVYIFEGNGRYHFKSTSGDLIIEIEGKYKMWTDLGQDRHPLLVLTPSPFISPSGEHDKTAQCL